MAVRLLKQLALFFGAALVRVAVKDTAWMTWQAAKRRMLGRSAWRRAEIGMDVPMMIGPAGERTLMEDPHIEEWWRLEGDYDQPF